VNVIANLTMLILLCNMIVVNSYKEKMMLGWYKHYINNYSSRKSLIKIKH